MSDIYGQGREVKSFKPQRPIDSLMLKSGTEKDNVIECLLGMSTERANRSTSKPKAVQLTFTNPGAIDGPFKGDPVAALFLSQGFMQYVLINLLEARAERKLWMQ